MNTDNKEELVEMLFKISRLMKEKMSYTNNIVHLSILQIQALFFLNKNKKASMSDIAEYFHIELSSATSLLNKLYDQDFVKRLEDEKDRRLVIITLTSKGKELLERAMLERREKIEKILSYLSDKEKTDLLLILKTLSNKIQK